MVDDFCQSQLQSEEQGPGRPASLQCSEVITLALFGQWVQFKSERAFYRYAQHHRRAAFPDLPDRGQLNRLMCAHRDAITAFGLHLVQLMQAQGCPYEVLDSTAAVTRDAKRRGVGWLVGQADIGWSTRIGWYEGFHLRLCVTPIGVITGFGEGAASTHDQPLAETWFAARQTPSPRLGSRRIARSRLLCGRPWLCRRATATTLATRASGGSGDCASSKSQTDSLAQSEALVVGKHSTDHRNRQ